MTRLAPLVLLLLSACGSDLAEADPTIVQGARALATDALGWTCNLPVYVHRTPEWEYRGETIQGITLVNDTSAWIEVGSTYLATGHELIHCHELPTQNPTHAGWPAHGYWALANFSAWTVGIVTLNGGPQGGDPSDLGPLRPVLEAKGYGPRITQWRADECAAGWTIACQ